MTREEIQDRVEDIITDSPYCDAEIEHSYDSLYELGFDSLSVLELGEDIQDEFGFTDDLDINKHSTPSQIADEVWAILHS